MSALQERPISLTKQMRGYRERCVTFNELRDDEWTIYGSEIESYDEDFYGALEGITISQFIQRRFSPTVIDLMSPSDTLADLFTKTSHIQKTGIAVSLKDKRDESQKERDSRLGITQIEGDLTRNATWKMIQETLGDKKADLIIERGAGAISLFPQNERLFAILLSKMWDLLSKNNGTMLLDALAPKHVFSNPSIEPLRWVRELSYYRIPNNFGYSADLPDHVFVKIVKTPNSPKELPKPYTR